MNKITSFVLIMIMTMASSAHALNDGKIEIRGRSSNGTFTVMDTGIITKVFTEDATQQSIVTLTASAFTNVSVPSGAKAVLIDVGTNSGIKLKGVTGDTGISLDSTCPVLMPLSTDGNTTMGFQNMKASSAQVRVYFF